MAHYFDFGNFDLSFIISVFRCIMIAAKSHSRLCPAVKINCKSKRFTITIEIITTTAAAAAAAINSNYYYYY
jgi:hypothetical protein